MHQADAAAADPSGLWRPLKLRQRRDAPGRRRSGRSIRAVETAEAPARCDAPSRRRSGRSIGLYKPLKPPSDLLITEIFAALESSLASLQSVNEAGLFHQIAPKHVPHLLVRIAALPGRAGPRLAAPGRAWPRLIAPGRAWPRNGQHRFQF